ncbi:zinc finger protein DHHC domain-containing protein [Theileria equi strain WA]|uniref:Palmitoyltransferase n=1 Tax=Theileria equi strain WA TaxID=1537102 RepID=L0AYX1_THEEQ|nr:zinc finger protein DHHC domain-containing protein [Theileria equi strain WA]AFZ80765.1 zinc finger protein DHHC domain-containing protein [Theileria equi strain WA]|eukprot:XP_004830431.1 zinc finger protein DHHC domain-containing protein [Theileria equi strain WA]
MGGILTLNLKKKCGEDGTCTCQSGSNIPGIEAKKFVDKPTKGFIKYVHYTTGGIFKLSKTLGSNGGRIIEVGGTGARKPIEGVKEVAVYYWNGAPNKPILLGITKDYGQPTLYGKYLSFWGNEQVKGLGELDALDDFNCKINDAVVFNITSSQSSDLLNNSNSTCITKYRNIAESNPPNNPSGSEYVTTAYKIHGHNTKISRVTYKGKDTDIDLTKHGPVSQIRLYSYPGSVSVPIMLEFKPPDSGTSRWFYSTNINGVKWLETGDSGFYDNTDNTTPKPALSEQLDKVLCSKYNNVTLNLTKGTYNTGARYCCDDHKSDARISVIKGEIRVNGQVMTSYYQHTIRNGYSLGGIYYKDGSNRNKITLPGVSFPISGINNVYVFYCQGNGPSLIYVDSGNSAARGWYKNSNGQWTWILQLSGIKHADIDSGPNCSKWKRLKEVLSPLGCDKLEDCTYGRDNEQKDQDEKQLAKEEKEAEKERNNALKPPLTAPVLENSPSTINSDDASEPEDSGGEQSLERSETDAGGQESKEESEEEDDEKEAEKEKGVGETSPAPAKLISGVNNSGDGEGTGQGLWDDIATATGSVLAGSAIALGLADKIICSAAKRAGRAPKPGPIPGVVGQEKHAKDSEHPQKQNVSNPSSVESQHADHALIILLIWSFVMTSVTEPGYIPSECITPEYTRCTGAWKLDSNCIYECNERKRNGEFRYCKVENCYKPDRAHFCRKLGKNVLKMDHYCPWVSNCIGFYNYKFFFQTLFYSNSVNIFMLNHIYHEFFKVYYDQNSTFNELFYLALIGTLITIITLIIFPFMLFHLWLISINKTTIEFCEWKASGSYNYNLGIISNFKQVFGTNILFWFLPIGYPVGDGLHFKGGLKYQSVLSL